LAESSKQGELIPFPKKHFEGTTKVLFVELFEQRHSQFWVKGPSVDIKHAFSLDGATNLLKTFGPFDVIFLPGYYPEGQSVRSDELVKDIVRLQCPKLIIFQAWDIETVVRQVKILKPSRIPWANIPWNYQSPTKHERRNVLIP
jgi:hypothetical protein